MQPSDRTSALMHRWFVEYNPVYLLSATLVLGGLWLVSRDMARASFLGGLGVGAIAELYALALIGSAALLWRRDQRRIAVMLVLLAAVYQCDPTMQVELFSFLGARGVAASGLWIGLFAVKLGLIARALELRLARSAWLVAMLGALGVALLPHVFRLCSVGARGPLVGLWILALGASALWSERRVESAIGYDVRGRRAVVGVWMLGGGAVLAHVAYWCASLGVSPVPVLAALALLATRWAHLEVQVWVLGALTLAVSALTEPTATSSVALMLAAILALRALRSPGAAMLAPAPAERPPYRSVDEPASEPRFVSVLAPPAHDERRRLLLGALTAAYFAAWTHGHATFGLPPHVLALDLVLAACCLVWAWRARWAGPLAPLALVAAHGAARAGWLVAPRTTLEWGATSIALGFVLLAAGVGATVRRAKRAGVTS